jgi:hypothetical protein
MKFDSEGHIVTSPREVFQWAAKNPRRLIDSYLLTGTPWSFPTYDSYRNFLEAIYERIGIHPNNLFMRGSCHLGFSISPEPPVWSEMKDGSDLDLAIVDANYFDRMDKEIQEWEERNRIELQGKSSGYYIKRQDYRRFNCCAEYTFPSNTCVHHRDVMLRVAKMEHCGRFRSLSAFIFRDWFSARLRCESDLRKLCDGVKGGRLVLPEERPVEGPRGTAVGVAVLSAREQDIVIKMADNTVDHEVRNGFNLFYDRLRNGNWHWSAYRFGLGLGGEGECSALEEAMIVARTFAQNPKP